MSLKAVGSQASPFVVPGPPCCAEGGWEAGPPAAAPRPAGADPASVRILGAGPGPTEGDRGRDRPWGAGSGPAGDTLQAAAEVASCFLTATCTVLQVESTCKWSPQQGQGIQLTSARALRSCILRPPSSFTTFLAPSATAASMCSRCRSSSASSSGPGVWGTLKPQAQAGSVLPALLAEWQGPKASPGSGDPLASRLLIFMRSRATFSWESRSICWAAARSFLSYRDMTSILLGPRADRLSPLG